MLRLRRLLLLHTLSPHPPIPVPSLHYKPQILGIPATATDREIKQAYRRLSMTHHPDKGGNQELFQKIAKAYEALSEPEARANWEKYGNPDGRQAMEVGIGMPSILIHEQGRYVFLALYLVVLIVGVPLVLRRLWNSTKGKTIFGLLQPSLDWTASRARFLQTEQREKGLPETFAALSEVASSLKYTRSQYEELARFEAALKAEKKPRIFYTMVEERDAKGKPVKGSLREAIPPNTIPRLNTILLHAHMNRLRVEDPANKKVVLSLIENLLPFVRFNVQLAKEWQHDLQLKLADPRLMVHDTGKILWLDHAYASLRFGAGVIQQLYGDDSSLSQVFTDAERAKISGVKRNRDLRALLTADLPEELARVLTDAIGPAGTPRRAEVDAVLADLPILDATAHFGVANPRASKMLPGVVDGAEAAKEAAKEAADMPAYFEPRIYEGDMVTLTVTLRHRNVLDDATVPPVFAPRFPREVREEWQIFLLNDKDTLFELGPAARSPQHPRRFNVFCEGIRCDKGMIRIRTLFEAPPAGRHNFRVKVVSSVYAGLDFDGPVEQ